MDDVQYRNEERKRVFVRDITLEFLATLRNFKFHKVPEGELLIAATNMAIAYTNIADLSITDITKIGDAE